MAKLAITVIAAGNSSRLGQPKQLVELGSRSLLRHSLALAKNAAAHFAEPAPVYCVLGYEPVLMQPECPEKDINIIMNRNWSQGMGTSIAQAIKQLPADTDACMIMLVDQWRLQDSDLILLLERWQQHPKQVVCSRYIDQRTMTEVVGAPAIFPRQLFTELKHLREQGARKLLQKFADTRIDLDLPNAGWDLDTPEDLAKLRKVYAR